MIAITRYKRVRSLYFQAKKVKIKLSNKLNANFCGKLNNPKGLRGRIMTQSSQPFKHVLVIEDAKYRRTISLEEPTYSIGRHPSNAIVINSQKASRRHATLIRKRDSQTGNYAYWLLDGDPEGNKSFNGVFINGKKCLATQLKQGDLINFGCEVNATYHSIDNWSDNAVNIESLKSRPQKTTLILDTGEAGKPELGKTLQAPIYYDSLTDLPNQTLWIEYLATALKNASENKTQVAVLLLDLAKFSQINQTLGSSVGDSLLQEVGQRLKSCCRAGDIVARWQKDEFALLFPQIKGAGDIFKVKQRIVDNLNQPFAVSGQSINLSSDIGIAVYPQDGPTLQALVEAADANLQAEKQKSQQRPAPISVNAPQWDKVERRLRQALARGEFFLTYQPQVNIETGTISSLEALLRWQHPQKGAIPPHLFLPVVEKTDFTITLSQWVLETACRQNQAWQAAGLPFVPVTVNLSPRQFLNPELGKLLAQVLRETQLSPHWLELDITEKALLKDVSGTRRTLHDLHQWGIRLSLDDFGTGYASLNCLSQFPFDKLKISQIFIKKLTSKPEEKALIAAAIALGQSLNLSVVAEGVETQEQFDLLRHLQCQEIQGYWFNRPLPAGEVARVLDRGGNSLGKLDSPSLPRMVLV
jgi:diguanylate cyclase (GGDEF)-like protein